MLQFPQGQSLVTLAECGSKLIYGRSDEMLYNVWG